MAWPAAALVQGASHILGGLISDRGQRAANQTNMQIARENRAFQERMSGTAYQRASKDLEAAGLNRILALGTPATTPSGSLATVMNPKAATGRATGRAVSSAMALKKQAEEIHLMASQAAQLDSSAANQSAQASLASRNLQVADQTIQNLKATNAEIRARTGVHSAQATIQGTHAALYEALGPALSAAEKALPGLAGIFKVIRLRVNKLHGPRKTGHDQRLSQ